MAGDYKLPLAVTEWVRFYDGQFLQDQDFIDEQKYHLARHNRHHRTLHVTGVAEGLTAYAPANSTFQVKVRPGLALDPDGRQILLTQISSALDLPSNAAGSERWLYIAYHQVPDKLQSSGQGVEGETRWREEPYIFASDNPNLGVDDDYDGPDWSSYLAEGDGPPPPVLLAKLAIDAGGKVSVDNNVRHFAGVRLPGPDTLAPTLRTDVAGKVGLWLVKDNDLGERLTISPEGNVGINTNAPTAPLEIGSTLQATRNGQTLVGVRIAPTFDAAGKTNVKNYGLLVESGDVGIGTTTPSARLQVNGSFKALTNVSGERAISMEAPNNSNHRGDGNTQKATGLVYRVAQNPSSGDPILQVRSEGEAVRFFVEHDGWTGSTWNSAWFGGTAKANYFASNVGIGTTEPGEKLEVRGNALISGDLTVDTSTLYVDSTNNQVGIGTTSPENKLDVAGDLRVLAGEKDVVFSSGNFGNNNTTDLFFNKGDVGFNQSEFVQYNQNDNIEGNRYFQLQYTADAGGLTIRKGGNVGIGTTTPAGKLHILNDTQDANGNTLVLGPTDSANLRLGYHSDYSWIQSHGSKPVAINPVGNNVGIGTTAPDGKLDIAATGDGTTVLRLSTERAWAFQQEGTVKEAALRLRNVQGYSKNFYIDTDGSTHWRNQDGTTTTMTIRQKDGNVGIGTDNPQTKLHIVGGHDAALGQDDRNGYLMIGSADGNNIVIDDNEIMARVGTSTGYDSAQLSIQYEGGTTKFGGSVKIGNDDYVTTGIEEDLRMIRGTVKSDGTVWQGSGFSVSRISKGIYEVSFNPDFSARPSVVVTQHYPVDSNNFSNTPGNTLDNCVVMAVSNSKFKVVCGGSSGDESDRSFEFIAVGPR